MINRYVRFSPDAVDDLFLIGKRSRKKFGERTAVAYEALIKLAINELLDDPQRAGTRSRNELTQGLYFYHLKHSKLRQPRSSKRILKPTHYLAFRMASDRELHLLRILHQRMKPEKHLFPIRYIDDGDTE